MSSNMTNRMYDAVTWPRDATARAHVRLATDG